MNIQPPSETTSDPQPPPPLLLIVFLHDVMLQTRRRLEESPGVPPDSSRLRLAGVFVIYRLKVFRTGGKQQGFYE